MDIPDTTDPFRPNWLKRASGRIVVFRAKLKSDKIGFLFVFVLAMGLLAVKGSYSEGQKSILGALFTKYIDETAASIIRPTSAQLAEINSFSAVYSPSMEESAAVRKGSLATIQDYSVISNNFISTDMAEIDRQFSGKTSQISIYTVQEGDTLSFIAQDYGVTVNTIIWANNLTNINYLKPGAELKIPPVSGVIHKVKSGETMSSIAKKYGVEQESILSYNLLPKVDQIQIGQEIIIPGGKMSSSGTATAQTSVVRFAYLPDLGGFFAQPTTGYNWGRIHGRNGVDIANSCGTGVYAAAEGNVELAMSSGWNGGFGRFLRVNHANGTKTLYAHLSKLLVSQSQYVQKGQLVAYMGTTGRSTGCHLHFEVHGAKNPLAKY